MSSERKNKQQRGDPKTDDDEKKVVYDVEPDFSDAERIMNKLPDLESPTATYVVELSRSLMSQRHNAEQKRDADARALKVIEEFEVILRNENGNTGAALAEWEAKNHRNRRKVSRAYDRLGQKKPS